MTLSRFVSISSCEGELIDRQLCPESKAKSATVFKFNHCNETHPTKAAIQ